MLFAVHDSRRHASTKVVDDGGGIIIVDLSERHPAESGDNHTRSTGNQTSGAGENRRTRISAGEVALYRRSRLDLNLIGERHFYVPPLHDADVIGFGEHLLIGVVIPFIHGHVGSDRRSRTMLPSLAAHVE